MIAKPILEIFGPAHAKKLRLHGIKNALMLKHLPLCDAKRLLTIQGMSTVQELNGVRSIEKITREKKEVITSSRQFSIKVYDIETLECAIVEYTELAVERLRQQKSECRAIQVMISTCNYYSDKIEEQYSNGIIVQLPSHTSYTPDLVNATRIALPRIYRYGNGDKVVMITLLDLQPAHAYGRRSITLGKSYVKDGWQKKWEFLSPCVTTDIGKIPSVFKKNFLCRYQFSFS